MTATGSFDGQDAGRMVRILQGTNPFAIPVLPAPAA